MTDRKKPRKQRRIERREAQVVAAWTRVAVQRWYVRGADRQNLMNEACFGNPDGPVIGWVNPLVTRKP